LHRKLYQAFQGDDATAHLDAPGAESIRAHPRATEDKDECDKRRGKEQHPIPLAALEPESDFWASLPRDTQC
jgi:hypothetical protein